jgi:hypothetical protein
MGLRAKALAVLAAMAVSYVIGRGTQKTVTVEKIREVEKVAETKVAAAKAETATAKHQAQADKTQWRTRTIYVAGQVVEVVKEVVREVEKKVGETRIETVTKTVTVEKLVHRDRLVIQAVEPPRWSAAASVGAGLDRRMRYQGEVGYRLTGGLWLTGTVDVSGRALLGGVRWEF